MSNRDYSKYSKPAKQEPVAEIQDVIGPIEAVEPNRYITGIVTDCIRLNVRTGPSKDYDVLCELLSNTEVQIDESESSDDFYKICTVAGIEGFCMKKFIKVKE